MLKLLDKERSVSADSKMLATLKVKRADQKKKSIVLVSGES